MIRVYLCEPGNFCPVFLFLLGLGCILLKNNPMDKEQLLDLFKSGCLFEVSVHLRQMGIWNADWHLLRVEWMRHKRLAKLKQTMPSEEFTKFQQAIWEGPDCISMHLLREINKLG